MPIVLKPSQPKRWTFFSWIGALLRGVFAHGRVYQGDVADAGSIAELTLTETLELRVSDVMSILGALAAGGGAKFSPVYFTAAYNDPVTLDLTGLPDLPEDIQFVAVIERLAAGGMIFWTVPNVTFDYDPATGELVSAEAGFTATSTFMAIYITTQNAYDQVLNALQGVQMNAIQYDWVDVDTPITAGDFAVANPQDTGFFIAKGLKWVAVEVAWTALGADTITMTVRSDNTDAGTIEHLWTRGDYLYPNGAIGGAVPLDASGLTVAQAGAGTIYRVYRLAVHAINRMKIQFSSGVATGTITVRVTKQG